VGRPAPVCSQTKDRIPATHIPWLRLAIGDLHGNLKALEDLMARVLPEMRPDDTLVLLGGYIDRGPDSWGCVERILRLREQASFRVVALLGNHEQWMLRSLHDLKRHSWLVGMKALDTVQSYSKEAAELIVRAMEEEYGRRLFFERVALPYVAFFDAMPPEHLRFYEELKPFHQTPDVVWGSLGFPEDYVGNDAVVYGHRDNAIMDGDGIPRPRIGANRTYGIDTISHGVLTAMRFPDGKVFQSTRSEARAALPPPKCSATGRVRYRRGP